MVPWRDDTLKLSMEWALECLAFVAAAAEAAAWANPEDIVGDILDTTTLGDDEDGDAVEDGNFLSFEFVTVVLALLKDDEIALDMAAEEAPVADPFLDGPLDVVKADKDDVVG